MKESLLITGGAGFIGSHLTRYFVNKYHDKYNIINLDKLTYAGNLKNLSDLEDKSNYTFIKGDITNAETIDSIFEKYNINLVIHLAAESHVDRSIENPMEFVNTNVIGTINLLNSARKYWKDDKNNKFYHVSTDEVYGSLGEKGKFVETTCYDPRSPYSASKASSDHFVRSYIHTFGINAVISNCSNNYGPYQFPEKLLPLMINNIIHNKTLPIYGDGLNIRDWLYVEDHVKAIDSIFHNGTIGETYNIGGDNEWTNIDIVNKLCDLVDLKLNRQIGTSRNLIKYIKDRPGHDRRYAIDSSKLKNELQWNPETDFESGLEKTVDWYLKNKNWLDNVTSGEYLHYYNKQYKN